jgi:hypothetical protein
MFYSRKEARLYGIIDFKRFKQNSDMSNCLSEFLEDRLRKIESSCHINGTTDIRIGDGFSIIRGKMAKQSNEYHNYKLKAQSSLDIPAWMYYIDYNMLSRLSVSDPRNTLFEVAAITSGIRKAKQDSNERRASRVSWSSSTPRKYDLRNNKYRYLRGDLLNDVAFTIVENTSETNVYGKGTYDEATVKNFVVIFNSKKKKIFCAAVSIHWENLGDHEYRLSENVLDDINAAVRDSEDMSCAVKDLVDNILAADNADAEINNVKDTLRYIRDDRRNLIKDIRALRKVKHVDVECEGRLEQRLRDAFEKSVREKDEAICSLAHYKHDYEYYSEMCY